MNRIAIIAPYLKEEGGNKEFKSRENLGIAYLTAFLKSKGYVTDMINAHDKCWDNETVIKYIYDNEYDMIGVSCTSQRLYPDAKDLVIKLREKYPKVHIVMGGIFPSMEFKNIINDLPQLDTIIVGEGEYPIFQLAEVVCNNGRGFDQVGGLVYRTNNGIVCNPAIKNRNLSDLPFPEREQIDFGRYEEKFLRLLGGRGCYGSCAFCSTLKCYGETGKNTGKIYRDAKNVVDEMEKLIDEFNIYSFSFYDDIFFERSKRGRDWVEKFVDEVKKRALKIDFVVKMRVDDILEKEISLLKEIGLKTVFLGVESGVKRILEEMKKGATVQDNVEAVRVLRKYDVGVVYGYMGIIPTMGYSELKENFEFLINLGGYTERNLYNKLNLYTGCEYNEILDKQGLLLRKKNFWERNNYKFKDPKVELFSKIVDKVKKQLKPSKVLLNRIKLFYINNDQLEKFTVYDEENTNKWVKIIKIIFNTIDDGFINSPDDELPRTLISEINYLDTYINNIYLDIQKHLSVSSCNEMDAELEL